MAWSSYSRFARFSPTTLTVRVICVPTIARPAMRFSCMSSDTIAINLIVICEISIHTGPRHQHSCHDTSLSLTLFFSSLSICLTHPSLTILYIEASRHSVPSHFLSDPSFCPPIPHDLISPCAFVCSDPGLLPRGVYPSQRAAAKHNLVRLADIAIRTVLRGSLFS